MKKWLIIPLFALPLIWFFGPKQQKEMKKVYIEQVTDHIALNQTTQGIIDALAIRGYKKGENLEIRIESAQGNFALAGQIAAKFAANKPEIMVGVGTMAAQSLEKYQSAETKCVFSTVTDPIGANLKIGVSNFIDLEPQIAFFLSLQPNLKRLGFLYTLTEPCSGVIAKKLEQICPKMGITLVCQAVSQNSQIGQSALSLALQCDAIFISNDNTILGALPLVIAQSRNIPVYVSDTDALDKGAFAAYGPNQYEVGMQTGRLIADLLEGQNGRIEYPDKGEPKINSLYQKGS